MGLSTSRRSTPGRLGDGLHQPRLARPQRAAQGHRGPVGQHLGQRRAQPRGGGFAWASKVNVHRRHPSSSAVPCPRCMLGNQCMLSKLLAPLRVRLLVFPTRGVNGRRLPPHPDPQARLGDELADVASAARPAAARPASARASSGGTARINSKSSPSPKAWSSGVEPSASLSASRRASSATGTASALEHRPAAALFEQCGQVERQAVAHVDARVQLITLRAAAGPRGRAARSRGAGRECCRRTSR